MSCHNFKYGRFNVSTSNFKLYPRLNPANNSGIDTNNICVKGQSVSRRYGPLFENTLWKISKKDQLKFYLKMGKRVR